MKLKFLSILLIISVLLTGCDWLRSNLGLMTSQEIDQLKKKYEEKVKNDSAIIAVAQDSSLTRIVTNQNSADADTVKETSDNTDKFFYIILGSFKLKENADKLYNQVAATGDHAEIFSRSNGYYLVGVGGYATIEHAEQDMLKWMNKDICPDDVWVYNAKTGR